MRNRLYAFALALAALVAIMPNHASAQTRIGQVATVKPDAHADARLLSWARTSMRTRRFGPEVLASQTCGFRTTPNSP